MKKQWIALTLAIGINGCGGGSDIPPPAPIGVVSGNAVDALIIDGTVNAYDFSSGEKGKLVSLAPAITDSKGFFELSIQTGRDHPVLLEVTGGYYIEEASGQTVSLNENQYLWAAINYERGTNINTMITTWTHLAAAEAWHLAESGEAVAEAIVQANGAVSDWLGLDISTTYPINITDPNYSSAGFYDGVKYGLQSAALSQWAYQLSEQAGIEPHTNFTSIVISNIMVNDVQSDGQLDGVIDGARIVLGPVTLSNEAYRTNLARSALHVVNRADINQINVTVADTVPYVQRVAEASLNIFGDADEVVISELGPTVTVAQSANTLLSGPATLDVTVSDYVGIGSVALWANGELVDSAEFERGHSETVALNLNTELYDDGLLELELRASNAVGIESVTPFAVAVANNDVGVEFNSETLIRTTTHTITGQLVNANPPVTLTVDGQDHQVTGTDFAIDVTVNEGVNTLPLSLIDADGKTAEFEHVVNVDMTPPTLAWETPERALTYDGSASQEVSFPMDGTLPLYIRYENARLGTLPATRSALDDARIPYLEAVISDDGAVASANENLSAEFTLMVDGAEVVSAQSIQRNDDGQFILPLVQEFIPPLFEINAASVVVVQVAAMDEVGNRQIATFPLSLHVDMPSMFVDSTFSQSQLALHRYHSPTMGTLVKDCTADSQGDCAMRLHSAYPLLRLSATGGEYVDLDGQRFALEAPLATLTDFYEQDKIVYFTPLSAVLLGLYDFELSHNQVLPTEALQRARVRLVEIYGFDPLMTPVGDLTGQLDDANRHALLMGGYSKLYDALALETPLQLLRAMQDDLAADGYLDGIGSNGAIELGGEVITAEFWRQDVAEAINAYHNEQGKPLGDTNVGEWAQQISLNTESIFRNENTPEGWDKHPPQLVDAPKVGQWLTGQTTFPVSASDDTGIAKLALIVARQRVAEQSNQSSVEFALDSTEFNEGENDAAIEIVDEIANVITHSGKVYIDNSDPALTPSPLAGQWVTGSVDLTIGIQEISPYTHTITHGQTQLASVEGASATIDTTAFSDGPVPLLHTVTDSVNRSASVTTGLSVDNTLPVILPTTYGNQWVTGTVALPIRVNDASPTTTTVSINDRVEQTYSDTNLDALLSVNTTGLSDGDNTLLIQTADSVALTAQLGETLKVDNTNPVIYGTTQDSQWHSGQIEWYAQISDVSPYTNEVQINGVKLGDFTTDRFTIDTTALSDGTHQLTYDVADSVGRSASRNFALNIDNTAPVIQPSGKAGTWQTGTFRLPLVVVDGSPTDIEVKLAGNRIHRVIAAGVDTEISVNTNGVSEGDNTLEFIATDSLSRTTTMTEVIKVDNTDPTIYQSTQDGQWQSGQVQWYAQISDISPYTNEVQINGVKLGDYTSDQVAIDTTTLSDGTHQLTYEAEDSVGRTTSRNFVLKVDNTDPVIADWAGSGAWYRQDFTFATTVTDASLSAVTLHQDNNQVASFTDGNVSRSIDVDALSNGNHTLQVQAQDAAAHSAQRNWTFRVDKTGPTLTSSNNWNQDLQDVSQVTVSGTVSDAHSGVQRVTVNGQNATLSGNNWSRSFTVPDGNYNWAVVAYDQAGNTRVNTETVVVTSTPSDQMYMQIAGGGRSLTTNPNGSNSYTMPTVSASGVTSPVSLTVTSQFLDCAGNCSVSWSGTGVTQQGNNAVISRTLNPTQSTSGTATGTFIDDANGHTVTVQVPWTLTRTGECTPGQTEDRALLNCGSLNTHRPGLSQRTCQANGLWDGWVVIRDPVCSPNPIP